MLRHHWFPCEYQHTALLRRRYDDNHTNRTLKDIVSELELRLGQLLPPVPHCYMLYVFVCRRAP